MSPLKGQEEKLVSVNSKSNSDAKQLLFYPLYFVVPFIFVILFHHLGLRFSWAGFGLGALGWLIALILRVPISALAIKLTTEERAKFISIAQSGPLEELVRLGVLLLTATTFSWSASIGQGWAAIEIVHVLLNGILIFTLTKREDEEAKKAIEILKAQGQFGHSPAWGIVERIFASAYHIGATLIIAAVPWLVVILVPFHSFFNLTLLRIIKNKSLAHAEAFVTLMGILVFGIGLALQFVY